MCQFWPVFGQISRYFNFSETSTDESISLSTALIDISCNYIWAAPWGRLVWCPQLSSGFNIHQLWVLLKLPKYQKTKRMCSTSASCIFLPPLPSRCADTLFSKACLSNTSHDQACDDHFIPRPPFKVGQVFCDAMTMKLFPKLSILKSYFKI